jgi:hypothetical protein
VLQTGGADFAEKAAYLLQPLIAGREYWQVMELHMLLAFIFINFQISFMGIQRNRVHQPEHFNRKYSVLVHRIF